jgi:hypothetical protein
MKMKWTVIIAFCTILISCGGVTEEVTDSYDRDRFFTVNYEETLTNKSSLYLSDIAGKIEYISLETNDDCLLTLKPDFYFTDEYIFVDNSKQILQFDRKGRFIKQIGKHGRGPGEIGLIRQLTVLDDEKLLIAQTNWARKLYYFNYEGEFLRQLKVPDIYRIKGLRGNRLLFFYYCNGGAEEYMFVLTNSQGDTTGVVKNHYNWENTTGFEASVSYDLFRPFYEYMGNTYFKSRHNDTVYQAIGDTIRPAYFIDLGKYLLPQELRVEALNTSPSTRFQDFKDGSRGYRFVSTLEADEKLFISSQDYHDGEVQYNMLYYRPESRSTLMVDDAGYPSGILNNLDGGPDFWPVGALNDSTVYMWLLPHEILKNGYKIEKLTGETESGQLSNFKEVLDVIKEDDNPVLMLVYLK